MLFVLNFVSMKTDNTICDVCGVHVKPRGIGAHKRLKHQLIIRNIVRDLSNSSNSSNSSNQSEDLSNSSNLSEDLSNSSNLKTIRPSDYNRQNSVIEETQILKINNDPKIECVRPDGKHFYNELDLKIFKAKIFFEVQIHTEQSDGSLFSEMAHSKRIEEIIKDFERRFMCSFDNIKNDNPEMFKKVKHFDKEYNDNIVFFKQNYSRL